MVAWEEADPEPECGNESEPPELPTEMPEEAVIAIIGAPLPAASERPLPAPAPLLPFTVVGLEDLEEEEEEVPWKSMPRSRPAPLTSPEDIRLMRLEAELAALPLLVEEEEVWKSS